MTRFVCYCAMAVLTIPHHLGAQAEASDPAARRTAMQKLAFFVGEWSGDARRSMGPGRMETFRQTERVRFALSGQVLVIDGIGRVLAGSTPGDTAFQAFGVLDWRPERGYQLRSMTHEGREGTFALTLLPDERGVQWGFEVPGGKTRFTMRLTPEGDWHETGEFSPNGQQWIPMLDMRLRRVSR